MSNNNNNNNTHGHANQPPAQNPSWNPLQIPSYIPRQPQLAHMSNERPMVRSPLAWHAPAPPPDSIYNFMSANHKNLDHQMNPLLPPYVRGPSPFDSMDLSVQSSRSSNSPLNKSGGSQQQQHSVLPHDYVHKQQQQSQQHTHQQQQQQQQHQQQTQMHAPNSYPIHLPTSSPHAVSHAQSHQQQQQHQHRQQAQQLQSHPAALNPHGMPQSGTATGASTSTKYLSANGGDCEMLPPSLGHGGSSGPGSTSIGGNPSGSSSSISGDNTAHYMRDSEAHMQENYAKMSNLNINRSYDNELQGKPMHKPVELVSKDCNYTMPSNKMSHQQQQGSPKKHSPLRNYHHTHPQQQQQQQHYNSPHTHTISHNGPQTPPTPQSPVNQQQQTPTASHTNPTATATMQQLGDSRIMQTTSNIMDYNQLHLQHNNSYATLTHQQQLPTAQQPSPLHHQQQQQQQQQHKQQTHHPHFGTHVQRQQQLQQQQPLPLPPQLQQMHHHQTHHHHQQSTPPTLTNLDAYAAQQSNSKIKEHDVVKPTMSVLSPATPPPLRAAAAAHLRGQPLSNTSSFPIRSSSPDNAVTSNEDSLDSNSNSSRARRKRKPSKLSRTSSNESENEDEAAGSTSMISAEDNNAKHQNLLEQEPKTLAHRTVINKSPAQTQELQHISPRKANTNSPSQSDLERSSQLISAVVETASVAITQRQRSSSDDSENDKQTIENGRTAAPQLTPHKSDNDTDVETIDKIAEMIAKTASGNQEVHNSNSSSSSRSVSNIGSPKTKKQRQALKLRSAEQQNSNSNFSTNSNSYSESLPDHGGAANDNAVLAEELRKEQTSSAVVDLVSKNTKPDIISPMASTTAGAASSMATTLPRPLSPANYSRSCSSSSSSSSSCSNSTHSSSPSKDNKLKNPLELTPSKTEATTLTHGMTVEKQLNIKSDVLGDGIEVAAAKNPKNEDFKSEDGELSKPLKLLVERCMENKNEPLKSPAKSCFEEVENKLEEMFAGIEDEPPASITDENIFPTPSNVSEVANDLSLALELSTPVPTVNQQTSIKVKEVKEPKTEAADSICSNIQIDKAPPTKAAKKSTLPSPVKSSSAALLRTTPPRRRLSVLIEPANLKLLQLAENSRVSNSPALPDTPVDERPSTSAAAAAAAAAMASKATKERLSNESKNTAPVKKKQNKTKGAKKSIAASKTKSCVKAPKGKQNNKKQQKKHKGKQLKLDDEDAPLLREANGTGQTAAANADARYKSPYILVKRDGTVSVINAPTAEDLGAEKQTKVKKVAGHHRGYIQDRKNLRGMHSSTLSNKYDADTADKTWICVFCKRGPHRMGLGDLFGPYLVTNNCEEYKTAVKAPGALDLDAVMLNKRRRMDMVQAHPRNLPVVPAVGGGALHASSTLNRLGGNNKKKKKSDEESTVAVDPLVSTNTESDEQEDIEIMLGGGMCKVTDSTYEVWLHEDCAVWAPSVFLVGARVMGLDAAVWNSTCYHCDICAKAGAMICCLQRECSVAAHVPCARESQWSLNEGDFKVFCQRHVTYNSLTATTTAEAATETLHVPSSSVLAALLNRPPAKPTSSNIHALHRS